MRYLTALFTVFFCSQTVADVVTHVIDGGAGLATVTRFDDGRIMVFDTGHWDFDDPADPSAPNVPDAFRAFIGDNDIDLMIISHSDSDHAASTDELFQTFRIHRVIRTGHERPGTATWEVHDGAIREAAEQGLTHDIDLGEVTLPHGTTYTFGDTKVSYLSGFHDTPDDWGIPPSRSEFRNANSVVIRVEYQGNAILFTGDAVGREEGEPDNTPAIATERYLIDNRAARPIRASVMFAPHHGGDDASSEEFIRAVNPQWIIFSSGHAHDHPLQVTADRYIGLGFNPECMLRTDLGDDEPGNDEWDFGRIPNNNDPILDDSIEIRLPKDGSAPRVNYVGRPVIACNDLGLVPVVPAPDVGIEVRMSRSGLCHESSSTWYNRMVHFTVFDSLTACMAAGGRERN